MEESLPSSYLLGGEEGPPIENSDTSVKDHPTDWKAICLATTLSCLCGVEILLVSLSRWPYMLQMDPGVTPQFFGFSMSISKCFHALGAFIFAYWAYKTREIRWPLFTGRLLAILSALLYLSVERLPIAIRKDVLIVCYILSEVSGASLAVLRAFVAACSSNTDRTRAFASLVLAIWISAMVAPLFQLLFTSMPLPGRELLMGLHLNLYTGPIYLALAMNILGFPFIAMISGKESEDLRPPSPLATTVKSLKAKFSSVLALDLNWPLVLLCWFQKMIIILPVVTMMTLTSPIMMTTFGWDGAQTVSVNSMVTAGVGVMSIFVTLFFLACKHSKRIAPRIFFTSGLVIFLLTLFFSYPFELISNSIPAFNETSGAGCNPSIYPWCQTARAVSPTAFIPSTMIQTAVGLPTVQIALDGVYSRLIGHLDQNLLQSAIVVAEDVVFIFGPSITTWIFSSYGQGVLWLTNGSLIAIGLVLWLCFNRQVKKIQ